MLLPYSLYTVVSKSKNMIYNSAPILEKDESKFFFKFIPNFLKQPTPAFIYITIISNNYEQSHGTIL